MTSPLADTRTVAVKIGSALLVDANGLRTTWLASVAADIAALRRRGVRVLVVSSGAIALGCSVAGLGTRPLRLEEAQAAAAIGQIALARAWSEALGRHGLASGQVLLALADTEDRRRYLNARATMGTLLKLGAVPIVNENDAVATDEIRYGDNDRLAARVGVMAGADAVLLLSDVDGFYTANPREDANVQHLPTVDAITPEIEAMAGGAASTLSRGGMRTKVEAAKIATAGGAALLIADGRGEHPLRALAEGARSTLFAPSPHPEPARKAWIAGHLGTSGTLIVDDGAVAALRSGRSLLPAGVTRVEGTFQRGDTLVIAGPDGIEIARGLAAYDSGEARTVAGLRSDAIEAALGYPPRSAMVHRDDMVVRAEAGADAAPDIATP